MRQKTMYATKPDEIFITHGDVNQAIIYFRRNIEEIEVDGGTAYQADEYTLNVPFSVDLAQRIQADPETWINRAVTEDYNRAAALIRARRDYLLRESDSDMCLDRLGLTVPSGSTFTAWISFFRTLGEVLLGNIAAYRQALRDLPAQPGFPYEIEWPTK